MGRSGSWPPSYLFVYAKHVLCHFPGHNQLHVQNTGMKTWRKPELKLNDYYYLVKNKRLTTPVKECVMKCLSQAGK